MSLCTRSGRGSALKEQLMRKFSTLLFALLACFTLAQAQGKGSGFVGNGYYRVRNFVTDRYIYVTDNHTPITGDKINFQLLQLWKDYTRTISDPASVIYMKQVNTDAFDLIGQGTGVNQFTGHYVHVDKQSDGSYIVKASVDKGGVSVTMYLTDNETSSSAQGTMGTNNTGSYRKWIVDQIDSNSDTNYFGIEATLQAGGKFYKPFYADFPFRVISEGMHVYYVEKIKGENAVLKEVQGDVPAHMPVIIECTSSDPSKNRVELLPPASATQPDNKLVGNYFCNGSRPSDSPDAYKKFDAAKMRVLTVKDDKLVFSNNAPESLSSIKVTNPTTLMKEQTLCIPANTSYLAADAGTAAQLGVIIAADAIRGVSASKPLMTAGVYSVTGRQVRKDSDTEGLPAGLYIVNGKKVIVK